MQYADESGDVAELLKISRNMETYKYLAIVEVEERPDLPASELAVAEISNKARIAVMTTETGLTLEDVVAGNVPWSAEDMAAFREFGRETWMVVRRGLCGLKTMRVLEAILARPLPGYLPR